MYVLLRCCIANDLQWRNLLVHTNGLAYRIVGDTLDWRSWGTWKAVYLTYSSSQISPKLCSRFFMYIDNHHILGVRNATRMRQLYRHGNANGSCSSNLLVVSLDDIIAGCVLCMFFFNRCQQYIITFHWLSGCLCVCLDGYWTNTICRLRFPNLGGRNGVAYGCLDIGALLFPSCSAHDECTFRKLFCNAHKCVYNPTWLCANHII